MTTEPKIQPDNPFEPWFAESLFQDDREALEGLERYFAPASPLHRQSAADPIGQLAENLYVRHGLAATVFWSDANPDLRLAYLNLAEDVRDSGWAPATG